MIPKIIRLAILLLGLLALASLGVGFRNGLAGATDFQWAPAKALLSGVDPYAAEVGGPAFACYAPSCLLLLAPWTLLSPEVARLAWLAMNVLFMLGFLAVMCQLFVQPGRRARWFLLATILMFMSLPFRQLLECGQHVGFSLLFFSLALLSWRCGWWLVSGLCLIPAVFKYTSMVPLTCVFVMLGCWRELGVAVLGHIMLTGWAALITKTAPWTLVLGSIRIGATQTGDGIADLASFVAGFEPSFSALGAGVGYVLCACALACLCIRLYGRLRDDALLPVLALLASLSCCMFYHRLYDFIVLLFVMFLVPRMRQGRWAVVLALGWFFVGFRVLVAFVPFSAMVAISFALVLVLVTVLWLHVEMLMRGGRWK